MQNYNNETSSLNKERLEDYMSESVLASQIPEGKLVHLCIYEFFQVQEQNLNQILSKALQVRGKLIAKLHPLLPSKFLLVELQRNEQVRRFVRVYLELVGLVEQVKINPDFVVLNVEIHQQRRASENLRNLLPLLLLNTLLPLERADLLSI